ncbi:MAG: phosphate/phosphite/phosphonate ABC transporter substrate-binding protein [Burkholderiales bacterium]
MLRHAALFVAFAVAATPVIAQQKQPANVAPPNLVPRLVLAINEGAAGNVDASDILLRYERFKTVIERALGSPIVAVPVRGAANLRRSLESRTFGLVISRPVDVLAEAVRDYGYQPVVAANEVGHAYFIVLKESKIKTIADIRGTRIVTPDRFAYMWRIANAMMRDNKIDMSLENVKSMSDQAGIAWTLEQNFYDVGVVASFSGVGRTWEKKSGRVIAKSRDLPMVPMVASPKIPRADIAKIRAALTSLDASEAGVAILKEVGVTGFKDIEATPFIDLLTWLGEIPKQN